MTQSVTRIACLALFTCACGRADSHDAVDGGRGSVEVAAATPGASVSPPVAGPDAAVAAASSWHGTYRSAAGTLYVPPDWKNVHWKVPETPSGMGDGAIAMTVDPTSHRILGAIEGTLGPATIDGYADEGTVTATVARRDPSDRGFTGTLLGVIAQGTVTGTIHLALAEVSAIRTATFTLAPDPR